MPHHANGRRFRFVVFNDLHVTAPRAASDGRHGYPGANERAAWAVTWARGETGDGPAADVVVSAGDLIHGERDAMDVEYQNLREAVLRPLSRPLLPCAGNHENRQGEGDEGLCLPYEHCHGRGRWNYIFSIGGLWFLVVDTSGGGRNPDAVTARRNAFVARALEFLRGRPAIVVTHVPLVPMRDETVLAKSFGFRSWCNRDPAMLQHIQASADHVLAVISAHLHLTGTCVRNGIRHIVPSGTASFPSDLAAFDVYPGRIEVRMHTVPASVRGPGEPGNIHGRERHRREFTDSRHADGREYVRGRDVERSLVIPLRDRLEGSLNLQVWEEHRPNSWAPAPFDGIGGHS